MCELIAEIGGNHEGDFNYAKRLVNLACASDATIIKTQAYTGDTLVNSKYDPNRNLHFKKFELSLAQNLELARIIKSNGKKFSASIWNKDWIDDFLPFVDYFKVGSGDLTDFSMLEKLAETEKPIILSTGISFLAEVVNSVEYLRSLNKKYFDPELLIVLQCTSMYPIDYKDANINVMNVYRSMFNSQVGYSDHTIGTSALKYAKALGADFLEFHFTDDKTREFRDHQISLTNDDIALLKREFVEIECLLGNGIKRAMEIELENNHDFSFRRALYPSKDLDAGEILTSENIIALRPCQGIGAEHYTKLLGKKLVVPKTKYSELFWNDFE